MDSSAVGLRLVMLDLMTLAFPTCWDTNRISPSRQYYLHWFFDVLILPGVITAGILLRYHISKKKELNRQARELQHEDHDLFRADHEIAGKGAASRAQVQIYVLCFFLIPNASYRIFEALQPCRQLGHGHQCDSYTVSDYSVSCCDSANNLFKVVVFISFAVIPLGLPAWFSYVLHGKAKEALAQVRQRASQPIDASFSVSATCHM